MNRFGTDRYRTMYMQNAQQLFGRAFEEVFGFTEGRGAVRDKRGAYYIGPDGKPLTQKRFLKAYPFHGLGAVEDELGMCHVGLNMEPIYNRRFGWVSDFHEGLCAVRYRNGRYTYIDIDGVPWERDYRYCSDFSDGTAVVLDADGFTHIGRNGVPVHGRHFDFCHNYDHGYAPVMTGGMWYLVDREGNIRTESLDRIDPGNNGLFTAVKGEELGYIDKDLCFRRLYTIPEKVEVNEIPEWSDDILDREWDSCFVFMRHSERRSHFLCNDMGIGGTGLTAHGDAVAREIGRKIAQLNSKKVHAYCSPSRRCVTTANCIMGAMGVTAKVDISQEVGPEGTAFIYCNEYDEEDLREPSTLALCRQLKGAPIKGWYSNAEAQKNIFELANRFLSEDDSLTFCVNHDLFVIIPVANATGRFARDDWMEYCGGFLVIRRGKELFLVYKGREYPFDGSALSIDTSLEPTGKTMCLPEPQKVKGWIWAPPESIAWCGGWKDGMQTLCDKEGRFFHGRDDEYLAYNRTFAFAEDFSEQSAPVYKDGVGATHITDFGDYLNNRWFQEAKGYHEGLAAVKKDGKWSYVDVDGGYAIGTAMDFAGDFFHGEALVFKDGKPCRMDRSGKTVEL